MTTDSVKKIAGTTIIGALMLGCGNAARNYDDCAKTDSIKTHFDNKIDYEYAQLDILSATYDASSDKLKAESKKTLNRIDSLKRAREQALKREAAATLAQAHRLQERLDSLMNTASR